SRSSAEVVPDDSHDRARMRTSSQFRSREDPPRGRTASATATVARPAIRPNRAAERRVGLFTPPAYRGSDRLRQTPPRTVAERPPHDAVWRGRARPEVRRSVDIRPASIPLEDDLAGVAAEDDLKLPAADGRGVTRAHRARGHLVHVRGRQGIDLDFQTAAFLRHLLDLWLTQ